MALQQSFIALADQEVDLILGMCGLELFDDGGGEDNIPYEGGLYKEDGTGHAAKIAKRVLRPVQASGPKP